MAAEAIIAERPDPVTPSGSAQRRPLWLWLSPVIFVALYVFYAHARGPFYLGSNSDPDYAYLCNSLNIARGRAPHLVNHPGTPLQVLGGMVIKAAHPFTSSRQTADAVLRNPEAYLQAISVLLAALYALSLAVVGLLVWQRTAEWQSAFLLQAAPFLLGDQFRMLARVSAETLLLMVGILIAGALFLAARTDRPSPRMICALGFLAALGTTAKLSFLPLALVPLCVIARFKERGRFSLWFGAFTLMCLFPLRRHARRLAEFVHGLIFHQKKYGFGEPGVLPPEYFSTLPRLITQNPWLCLVVGLSWVTVLYGCTRWKREEPPERRFLLLLVGLAVAQTLQMLMVTKYGEWRYLLPALMFCPLNLLLLWKFWSATLPGMRPVFTGVIIIVVLGAVMTLPSHYLRFAARSKGRMQVLTHSKPSSTTSRSFPIMAPRHFRRPWRSAIIGLPALTPKH